MPLVLVLPRRAGIRFNAHQAASIDQALSRPLGGRSRAKRATHEAARVVVACTARNEVEAEIRVLTDSASASPKPTN